MAKRMYVRSKPSPLAADFERDQKRLKTKKGLQKRLEWLEEWMMNNPFTHPDFEKHVHERNNLLIRI